MKVKISIWVHVLSIISRGCVWEIDVWVLPALLQRLKGWGVSLSVLRPYATPLHQIGLHGYRPRRKPLLKMMHKKSRKQFAEDKQTKDMDYWNHVLWSDETKINLFGSDGVKTCVAATRWGVQRQVCLAYSQAWWWSVWGCMSAAGTGELQFIEGTTNANMYCDILKQSESVSESDVTYGQSMVTHTLNPCSAFNPSKVHTHSSEHTHPRSSGQPFISIKCATAAFMLRRPGTVGGSVPCSKAPQSWYWGWRERCTFTPPTYNSCRTWDSNSQPLD